MHGVVVLAGAVAAVEAYRALMRRHTVTRAAAFDSSAAGTVLIASTQIRTLTVALVALAAPVATSVCDGKRALQVRRYWGCSVVNTCGGVVSRHGRGSSRRNGLVSGNPSKW